MTSQIRFVCPTCKATMEAPVQKGGKKIHCLRCGQRLQIPWPKHAQTVLATDVTSPESVPVTPIPVAQAQIPPPLPAAVPLAAAVPPAAVRVEPLAEPDAVLPTGSTFNIWAILLLVGAGLLFLNFFLPWWRCRESSELERMRWDEGNGRTSAEREAEYERMRKGVRRYKEWMTARDPTLALRNPFPTSLWIWGWNTVGGIMGLIFSLLIAGGLLPSLFVRRLQPWVWIPSFVSALFALILLPSSFMWIFGAPSGTFGDYSGGNLLGPYVLLLASLLLILSGILNGVFQVRLFARTGRGSHPRA